MEWELSHSLSLSLSLTHSLSLSLSLSLHWWIATHLNSPTLFVSIRFYFYCLFLISLSWFGIFSLFSFFFFFFSLTRIDWQAKISLFKVCPYLVIVLVDVAWMIVKILRIFYFENSTQTLWLYCSCHDGIVLNWNNKFRVSFFLFFFWYWLVWEYKLKKQCFGHYYEFVTIVTLSNSK